MIPIHKIFILSFYTDIERKKEIFDKRLKSIPLDISTSMEVIALPEKDEIDEIINKNNLHLSGEWDFQQPRGWKDISLAIGHWDVWQRVSRHDQNKNILVLEEDFLPHSFHYHVLDTKLPWDLLYLGRQSNGGDMPLEGGLVNPGYSNGSFAYILNGPGLEKLITSGYERCIIPPGEFLSAMHHAHPNRNIRSNYSGDIVAIAPMKNFIERDTSNAWENSIPTSNTEAYIPLHPQLYNYANDSTKWVTKYLNRQLVQQEFDLICDEPIDNVYSFPLFTTLFCKEIIEEAEHFGQWSNYRGKHLDPIDMMLNSIDFNDTYTGVMKTYVYPLFCYKYQLRGDGWKKLNSQNFIVRYLSDKQGHLGIHNDGSYLSMVVTLNTNFEGGGTYFPKYKKLIKHDQSGYATVHPGLIGYLHGARPVTAGTRYILASFFFPGTKPPIAEGVY
jgi:hypothetical protein